MSLIASMNNLIMDGKHQGKNLKLHYSLALRKPVPVKEKQ